ncbi:MAG: nuclear transport factor 2 family protein [Pseudomonadota bacterium]
MSWARKVNAYYESIDAGKTEDVISMFSASAVYDRADKSYVGRNRIAQFYRNERKISGRHLVKNIWPIPSGIIAVGVFQGKSADGDAREIGFADFWLFDELGLVEKRQTYLATGHLIAER